MMRNKIKTNSSTNKDNISTKSSENKLARVFKFFARLAKLLILRKDDTDVISKYSTWLKTLENHSNDYLKYQYVKLLIIGLEHSKPICPFNEYPPETLEPIEDWLRKTRKIFQHDDPSCRPTILNPPIVTAVSNDKCQFAACQTIPNVGIQCYYAQSDEPLYKWLFKFRSLSKKPEDPVHSTSLEWERSLAGIHRKYPTVISENSRKIVDPCIIQGTSQENLNTEEPKFKWNEMSVLTGDTIPGSDLCIDWLIHEHERTQLEIDEEVGRSFDKLYPDNFHLLVNPALLGDILKTIDLSDKNVKLMEIECEKMLTETNPEKPRKSDLCNHHSNRRSDEKLLTPERCEQLSTDFSKQIQNDYARFENKDVFNSIVGHKQQPYKNDSSDTLPSFTEVAESFKCISKKAEQTMKEVNDWFQSRRRQ